MHVAKMPEVSILCGIFAQSQHKPGEVFEKFDQFPVSDSIFNAVIHSLENYGTKTLPPTNLMRIGLVLFGAQFSFRIAFQVLQHTIFSCTVESFGNPENQPSKPKTERDKTNLRMTSKRVNS
ncbi:hypothetical protein pipiens_013413 [Culex pipiens pipiens]|uniref:Uncharacterized protein n=1 Tax=Culex pipiens pipiens TaxID=38569 RepID=A0ABD1CYL3_CULPP